MATDIEKLQKAHDKAMDSLGKAHEKALKEANKTAVTAIKDHIAGHTDAAKNGGQKDTAKLLAGLSKSLVDAVKI